MPTKEELKENILAIWKISSLAKQCFEYSYYLHKPETPQEFDYLRHSRHFHFIKHILWRNTVIELSKLFNKSPKRDKFNIFHFINKLGRDQYFGGFEINPNKINEWETQLESNKETIDKILTLRDKVYGHTDTENAIDGLESPTFEKTKELIDIVKIIIQEVYATAFDIHAMVDRPQFDGMQFDIIKVLANENNNKINNLIKELNKNKK